MGALDRQVGGDHYKSFVIQPVEFITKNDIRFLPGCIIKRACRYDKSGGKGLQDLEKIKHEVDLLVELHEMEEFRAEPERFTEEFRAEPERFMEEFRAEPERF